MDHLAVGGANATALLVQQAPRARALQRVNDTMVGFQVYDIVEKLSKRE
jgi:hypothetical protein